LWESHAILSYLGDKTGKLWPTSAAGRADAPRWLFFLSQHIMPSVHDLAFNRIAIKFVGGKPDEDAIARGEKALPAVIGIVEGQLAKGKWVLGDNFTLVDCAYGPSEGSVDPNPRADDGSKREGGMSTVIHDGWPGCSAAWLLGYSPSVALHRRAAQEGADRHPA
jgi:Glutathione S-transferase, C-terminal domain